MRHFVVYRASVMIIFYDLLFSNPFLSNKPSDTVLVIIKLT